MTTLAQEKEKTKLAGEQVKSIIFDQKYFYNEKDDNYVVFVKSLSKNVIIEGGTHRAMVKGYSDGQEIEEICAGNNFPFPIFQEYKASFGLTRNGTPLTDEEVLLEDEDRNVAEIVQMRKFDIAQKAKKEQWKDTEKKADKWDEYSAGLVNPLENAINNWNPDKVRKVSIRKPSPKKKSYVMIATDWHIGAKLTKIHSFRQDSWGKKEFEVFFQAYLEQNLNKIKKAKNELSEIVLLSLGDILDGLRGETEKGTKLEQEFDREEQFTYALETIDSLIQQLVKTGLPIRIHSIKGNHDGLDNFILFETLKRTYEGNGVKFHNSAQRCEFVAFSGKETLFLIDHGAHDIMNAKVPSGKAPREAYIQSMFMTRPELLVDYTNRYFIQGDQHHNEIVEFNDFTFIMVSSPAKSLFSDANNWNSRPCQSSYLVGDSGIEETYNFYFD